MLVHVIKKVRQCNLFVRHTRPLLLSLTLRGVTAACNTLLANLAEALGYVRSSILRALGVHDAWTEQRLAPLKTLILKSDHCYPR